MAGSDPFDDYFAQATGGRGNVSREPSSSGGSWGDYLYDAPGKIADWYKTTPWAGKPFGWVQGVNDAIETGERTLEPYIGKTGARIASLPARAQSFGAEMFFGSPADLVGTAAAIPTWGQSLVPTVGPKLLAKAPAIVGKAAPYVMKGLNYAGRASDALQSLYQGTEAVEQAKQGNYGTAAMQAGGSVLSGIGAADYVPFLGKSKTPEVAQRKVYSPEEMAKTKAEYEALRAEQDPFRDPRMQAAYERNVVDQPLPGAAKDAKTVRESYTQNGKPTAITDESRLLGQGDVPLINRPRGATGTALVANRPVNRGGKVTAGIDMTQENLAERAVRDFDALGIAETNDRVLRYLQDPKYREKIELAVAQGKTGTTPKIIEHNVLDDYMRPIGKREFTSEQKAAEFQKLRELEEEYFTTDTDAMADRLMSPTNAEIEGKKYVANKLSSEKIDELQDLGLVSRTEAAELRMHKAGLDPEGRDMTIDQPMNATVPWDSPAGGYTGTVGEVRPGTPPTMKPSRTLFKRSHNVIDEMVADSPNNSGYFPRTTHMAPEDRFIDEFGQNVTRRELPEGEKIFDIRRGLSPEQVKEVTDFAESRGRYIDLAELHVLETEAGPRLSGVLTDIMTSKDPELEKYFPNELSDELDELAAKWRNDIDNWTGADETRLDELNKLRTKATAQAFRDSKVPAGFRDFMKERGYFATNYRGISGDESIAGVAPQEGFAIVDPSGLPRTKTVERGGVPPRVGGRMVDESGKPILAAREVDRVKPEATSPNAVKAKILQIFKETNMQGKTKDEYYANLGRQLSDSEIEIAVQNRFLSPDVATKARAGSQVIPPDVTGPNRPVLPPTGRWEPGPQQTMVAPPPSSRPVVRTMDDVRQQMIANGVANPSDELVRKVYENPRLLDKVVPPRSQVEGVSAEGRSVYRGDTPEEGAKPLAGLLQSANPEDIQFRKALEDRSNEFLKMITKTDEIGTRLDKAKNIIGDSEFGKIIDRVKTKQDGWFKKTAKGMGMSMETELERMGPGGKAVAKLFKIAATDAPIRFNEYMKGIDTDLRKMKHADFEKVVDAIEGKKVELTPELENFKNRLQGVLDQSGTHMEELGLLEKGKRANYFPHRYDGVPTEKLRERMRADNMSEDQIKTALNEIQSSREMKISGEYSRNELNVPGYRKDKDVLIDHLRETSKRIEHAKLFGAKDIADPTSQLSRFVSASENPERAKDIAERILRGGKAVSPESQLASKAIRNYATAAHLSLASISQLGGAVPIAMRTGIKDTMMGLGKALREDPNSKFMRNVNYARDFATHWNDGAQGDRLYRAFGIAGVQNYMNKVAGQAGYAHAQTLFDKLKNVDPTNKLARKQLEDLTLTDIGEVLKQPALTEKQLQRAMTRMAEISQGTVDPKNLPYHWVGNGTRLIPQIFQRMAFQGSRAIKDGLMEGDATNRLKKLGTLAVTGLVAGEVIGDVKEIPKTALEVGTNSVSQMMGYTTENKDLFTTDWQNNEYLQNIGIQKDDDNDRFGYTRKMIQEISPEAAKDDNVVRGIANLMASYASGMTGDMLLQVSEAANDRRPLNAMASGFWAYDELQTGAEAIQDLAQGNWRDPLRQAIRRVPVVGSGIVREIDTDFQAGGGGREGRSNAGKTTVRSTAW